MTKNCIPYKIVLPKNKKVGILLSIPHSGTNFPQELSTNYNKELSAQPDDTDSVSYTHLTLPTKA